MQIAREVVEELRARGVERFGVRIHGTHEYPARLRDAKHPIELLCFQGVWELVETPSVAVIGTREPSDEGRARARKLVRALVEDGRTIVSELAAGIDTVAHTSALEAGGQTIAVISPACAGDAVGATEGPGPPKRACSRRLRHEP